MSLRLYRWAVRLGVLAIGSCAATAYGLTAVPSGVTNIQAGPDVVEAGRVLAQLDDWRAIMMVLIVFSSLLIAALLFVIGFAFRAWMKQSDALSTVAVQMAANTEAIRASNMISERFEEYVAPRGNLGGIGQRTGTAP